MTADRQKVTITLPADTSFVALARVAAASVAVELGFSVDEIENLRIAVDELVTILIDADPSDGTVTLVFTLEGSTFSMAGSVQDRRAAESTDPLTLQILRAVADTFHIDDLVCSFRAARTDG